MTMTRDEMFNLILDNNNKTIEYMAKLSDSMANLNDKSVYHSSLLVNNTKALNKMVTANEENLKMFRIIFYVIVIALVVLAGAEKALPYLGL